MMLFPRLGSLLDPIVGARFLGGEPAVSDPSRTDASPYGHELLRTGPITGRFEVRATTDSHFSRLRTRVSLGRTLLSWIRTAVPSIGFAMSILPARARISGGKCCPWYMGLALMYCGVLAVPFDCSLPLERRFRTRRRDDKGRIPDTGYCVRSPPHSHRCLRFSGRADAFV
jgi:hypothetical protein